MSDGRSQTGIRVGIRKKIGHIHSDRRGPSEMWPQSKMNVRFGVNDPAKNCQTGKRKDSFEGGGMEGLQGKR